MKVKPVQDIDALQCATLRIPETKFVRLGSVDGNPTVSLKFVNLFRSDLVATNIIYEQLKLRLTL